MHLRRRGVTNSLHSSPVLSDDLLWGNKEECEDSAGQHENEKSDVGSCIVLARSLEQRWRGICTICYV